MISKNFDSLIKAASSVSKLAQFPYSNIKVGAAFLTQDNKIITGCNVENAAYPQSQCAEATAIGNMISNGSQKILEIVVILILHYNVYFILIILLNS